MADINDGADAWAEASRRLREQQLAPQVANSISSAANVNPDGAAKANVTARFLGIPPESAAAYPDDVARQAKVQQLNAPNLVAAAPTLARFLTTQSTANAIHDDLPNAQALEQTVKTPPPSTTQTPISTAIGNLFGEANRAFGAAVSPAFGKVFQAAGAPLAAFDALAGTHSADVPFSAAQWFNDYAQRYPTDPHANFITRLAQTAGSTAGLISEALATGGESVAPRAGAGLAEVLGAHVAHGVQAMTVPAALASQETAQRVQEQGGSTFDATKAGVASYITNTLGGVVPFATPGSLAARMATGAVSGTLLSENSRKLMNWASPESMQQPEPTMEDRALDAVTGMMFGGFTGAHEGPRALLKEQAQAHGAEQDFAHLSTLGQLSAASKWRERDPEGFKQFVQATTEDGNLANVYVDARTFSQSLDKAGVTADELRTTMPGVADQMVEALHTNGDVQIPTADYATHIAGGPLDADLLQHLKTDPEGKTYAEAQQFYQNQATQMKETAAKFVADKAEQDAFRTSQDVVQQRIHNQLDELGRQPTDVNKINATVQAAILSRVAAEEGITPEEAQAKYGANIAGETSGGLEQAPTETPQFKNWFGGSKVVDKKGSPLTVYHGTASDVSEFDAARSGSKSKTGAPEGTFFFTDKPDVASSYTTKWQGDFSAIPHDGANVMPVHLAMEKPLKVNAKGEGWREILYKGEYRDINEIAQLAKDSGKYDGVIVSKVADRGVGNVESKTATTYIAFKPEQIKSAIGNSGEFDPNNPSVLKQSAPHGFDEATTPGVKSKHSPEQMAKWAAEKKARDGARLIESEADRETEKRLARSSDTRIRNSDMWGYFTESEKSDIDFYSDATDKIDEGKNATINAIERALKNTGITIEHISSSNDGKSKSLYVKLGDQNIRVSDHELPMTPSRENDRSRGLTGKWDREVIVSEWQNSTMDEYLSEIGVPAAKRLGYARAERNIANGGAGDTTTNESPPAVSGGEFDPNNPSVLAQTARGTYNPSTQTISLLKDADLSTYLHETGHWALDTYARIAASDKAPPEIRADMDKVLKWFGVESLDKWHGMTLDEQRPMHEQFARGFEAYLMEGKAPSQELAQPFARIRSWMVDIYKSLRGLNVELSTEVRGVFDRMLASQEAIEQAQAARVFEPLFTAKPAGMTAAEWGEYRDMGQEATNEAISQMQGKSLRDMKWLSNAKSKAMKALQREAKDARDEVRAQVEKEVQAEPVYQMQDFIKDHRLKGGSNEALKEWTERRDSQREKAAEAVKAELLAKPEAKDLKGLEKAQFVSRARRGTANEVERRLLDWEQENKKPALITPGVDADLLAERFGFGSGEEALRALADAPPRKDVITGLTDRRMLEQHGELSGPDAIETAANEAVHNAARARFMATGLKVLADSPISARLLLNGAREAAEGAIAAKLVRDLNPRQYLAAETRANKEAIKLAPKDPAGAVQAQRAALLNNQLVKAAYDAQDLVRKALAYAKSFDRISKRLKIEPEERDMIDALLGRFDFRQAPPEGPTKQQLQLTQWVESQKALGYTPAEVPDMMNEAVRMHYKDMSVEQLRGLMDTIRSIEKVGRERRTVTVDGKRMDLQEAVAPMVVKMIARGEKFTDAQLAERPRYGVDPLWRVSLDRVQSLLRAGASEILRPDYKGNKYDLHELMGPFQKAITERLFKAGYDHGDFMDHVAQLKKQRMAEFGLDKDWQHTLDTVVADHNLMDNSLEAPSKRRLTRGDLIGIAMHVGNESNFDKLVQGMKWQPTDVWAALHTNLTEKDWNAAKTLGEMAGAKWDEMAAMNRRLGNDNPAKIEPRPFQTKFGEMPGWYSPIDYDPIRSRLGKRKADARAVNPAEGLFSSSYYRADTTTNGSLNARASGYYDFINLDWRPIEKRISDTMRDLAYREALIDVHKIYTNKDFGAQFQRSYGPEEYKHLGDWLGRLVNSEVGDEKQSILTAISAGTRRAMVANGVAFRISTMIKHGGSAAFKSTGYFAGGGEKYFGARLAGMVTNHNAQVAEALAKFPEIRQRARQQDRDFAQAVGTLFEPESIHGKAERFGHAGVAAMDFFTAVPTAHAAFDWAITEGIPKRLGGTGKPMSEADAIQFASKVVREAHGSTNEASQSLLINNKSEIVKALTTLHGFMNNAFGQTVDAADKAFKAEGFGKPELLARTLFAQIVPAIMAGWVTFGGPNENETWAGWLLHHIGGEFAGMLPMVREGWSAGVEGFSSAGLPPWIRALTDTVKVVRDVAKEGRGEEVKNPIKHVGNAGGLLLPGLGQAGSTTQFLYDEVTGKQHAETVAEWVRGVMSGTARRDH